MLMSSQLGRFESRSINCLVDSYETGLRSRNTSFSNHTGTSIKVIGGDGDIEARWCMWTVPDNTRRIQKKMSDQEAS